MIGSRRSIPFRLHAIQLTSVSSGRNLVETGPSRVARAGDRAGGKSLTREVSDAVSFPPIVNL